MIRTKEDQGRVRQLFLNNEAEFLRACEREREEAKAYFERRGVTGKKNLYFDCGWNGSSQYLLDRFYRAAGYEEEVRFAYVGILDTQKSRRQLDGQLYDAWTVRAGETCESGHAACEGDRASGTLFRGASSVCMVLPAGEAVCEEELRQLQGGDLGRDPGVLSAGSIPLRRNTALSFSRQDVFAALLRLAKAPTQEEAVQIGNVENADGFVRQQTMKKYIAKLDMQTVRSNPNIEIYWEKGLLRRPDIAQASRCMLR